MNKFIVNFYEVEEGGWTLRNYFTIDSTELSKTVERIESRGFRLTMSNVFVKTFVCDSENLHFAYSIVEIPNL